MINPFSHIQDILNRSSKEAARTLGREIRAPDVGNPAL